MPMTVIVTRDEPARTRGFLASIIPEPAPGLYTAADLTKGVRGTDLGRSVGMARSDRRRLDRDDLAR
jgi:CRISPR-associated endoribonuclease Cas2 subtype I-E